ncbi:hypothetical protein FE784_11840 [Paenibacillus hemerocallicola]|uniref:Glycoside hydrolase n=1 Tax=Paenibacillus hemerocallicola TaxID=1172614 RepID=A0A5C4TAM0_9BACL|nr:glycosyl hydrolase [Paenibacillus hemerocallicola]TNJ66103.1 hypothetical protein FE784_11840 [Paenibacillus hemerocallicola]
MSNKYELFLNPTSEFKGKPLWAWNGKLNKEELIRQIHTFKEMGFGGFFMHSRTGLATEYLGEEWFELINACAEEAEKLGLEAWLYDEDRWPSGTAGGMVTTEPKYRLKFIRLRTIQADEFAWSEDIIAAFVCDLDGVSYTHCRRLRFGELDADTYGRTILAFHISEMDKSDFYNGATYVDTMNREATEAFLRMTHEKYKQYCGHRFGKSIKGIFIDEPHRGSLLDGFGITNEGKEWHLPWTYELFDRFREQYGYDLIERLPELFLQHEGRSVSQVKWQYTELVLQLFLANFAAPVQEWCTQNKLILTGHVLHEDSLSSQTAMIGSVMRYYEYMDNPGIDILTEGNRCYWVAKQLSSAARQLGKRWLLSELYGCTGWQMSFESHKAVGDWQTLFGINVRCHHHSWFTMAGESKRDFPGSISHQSTWWKDYKYVETYFSRMGVVLDQSTSVCDIVVLHPAESVWCQIYPGWSSRLSATGEEVRKLERQFRETFHWLAEAQIDFDYGDEGMIADKCRIGKDGDGRPLFIVGEAAYKAVVVSGMLTMRSSTLALLELFRESGGTIIFAGEPPQYIDAVSSQECAQLSAQSVRGPHEREFLVHACGSFRYVQVLERNTGLALTNIFCQVRRNGDDFFVMLLNVSTEEAYDDVLVHVRYEGEVEEWMCATGERQKPCTRQMDGGLEIITRFPPSGERIYRICRKAADHLPVQLAYDDVAEVSVQGPYEYRLSEPNVCVLDMASYQLNGGEWKSEAEILQVDRSIRRTMGFTLRGRTMVQPWFANKYKKNEAEDVGRVNLRFEFVVESLPTTPLQLIMEKPEHVDLFINGNRLPSTASIGNWIDSCFEILEFPFELLRIGENRIELGLDYHQNTDLEAIYLTGQFGIRLEGSRKIMTSLPETLESGDLVDQGFPFYSGSVIYKLPGTTDLHPEAAIHGDPDSARLHLKFPSFEAALVKVHSGTNFPQIVAWQPYETDITEWVQSGKTIEIEAVLTRRNTFGPLHLNPVYSNAYSPDHFVMEGDRFSEEYKLVPSGLLEPPRLVLRKLQH